jgi:hypothetical protein
MGSTVHIEREAATSLRLVNSTGVALVADEFTVMAGRGLVALEAIASLAEGGLQIVDGCKVQASDFVNGSEDTFATPGQAVYWDPTTKKFSDTSTATYYLVGHLIAAISGGVIDFYGCAPILVTASVVSLAASVAAQDVDAKTAQATIVVPLGSITMEDGTALTKQATTVTGFAQLANKEIVIAIPVNCSSGEALQFTTPIPQDLDDTADITIHALVGKDAANDALTLDCEVYPCAVGDLANADIQDTAATAIVATGTELVFTCGADGVLEAPGTLSVVLTLGGTNDGDAVYIYGVWVEYTRKLMTA